MTFATFYRIDIHLYVAVNARLMRRILYGRYSIFSHFPMTFSTCCLFVLDILKFMGNRVVIVMAQLTTAIQCVCMGVMLFVVKACYRWYWYGGRSLAMAQAAGHGA